MDNLLQTEIGGSEVRQGLLKGKERMRMLLSRLGYERDGKKDIADSAFNKKVLILSFPHVFSSSC